MMVGESNKQTFNVNFIQIKYVINYINKLHIYINKIGNVFIYNNYFRLLKVLMSIF